VRISDVPGKDQHVRVQFRMLKTGNVHREDYQEDLSVIQGWNGKKAAVAGPLTFPAWLKDTSEWKKWQYIGDIRSFTTWDAGGNKYVASALCFVKTADGTRKPVVPNLVLYRPDGTRKAVVSYSEGLVPSSWQRYDAKGRMTSSAITRGNPKQFLSDAYTYDPDGTEHNWQITPHGVVRGEIVTLPNKKSYYARYAKPFEDAPFDPKLLPEGRRLDASRTARDFLSNAAAGNESVLAATTQADSPARKRIAELVQALRGSRATVVKAAEVTVSGDTAHQPVTIRGGPLDGKALLVDLVNIDDYWLVAGVREEGAPRTGATASTRPAGEDEGKSPVKAVAPDAAVRGSIVDDNGRPVSGAVVRMYEIREDDSGRLADVTAAGEITTGADGSFRLAGRPGRRPPALMLLARKPGLALGGWVWNYGWATSGPPTRITLGKPAKLAGVVVDEQGRPVAGAVVKARLAGPEDASTIVTWLPDRAPLEWLTARTDRSGRFAFDQIPVGTGAEFFVTAPGRANTYTREPELPPTKMPFTAGDTDIRITLPPAASITGTVVDKAGGKGVPGVQVRAKRDGRSYLESASAVSDQDGRFRLTGLPGGEQVVELAPSRRLADWVAMPIRVEAAAGKDTSAVILQAGKGGVLEISVTDSADGKGIPNTQVNTFGQSGPTGPNHQYSIRTDADGVAKIRVLPGRYSFFARALDYRPVLPSQELAVDVAEGRTEKVAIRLKAAVRARGMVRDPAGEPVAGASIWALGADTVGSTAEDGTFDVALTVLDQPGQADSSPLRYTLVIRHRKRNLAAVVPLGTDPKPVNVTLGPAVTLDVRVVDAKGNALPRAEVGLALASEEGISGPIEYLLRTDEDGRREIRAVPRGYDYTLSAGAGASAKQLARKQSPFTVAPDATGTITRTIVLDAHAWTTTRPATPIPGARTRPATTTPAAPGTIAIRYDIPGAPAKAMFFLQMQPWDRTAPPPSALHTAVTNGSEQVLKDLPPGVYHVARTKSLRVGDVARGAMLDWRLETVVYPGRVTRADFLRKAGSPVRGEVLGLKNAGAAGAFVYVRDPRATTGADSPDEWELTTFDAVTCGPDGQFATETIPPGEYAVVVNAFKPEAPGGTLDPYWRLPDFVGVARVTVPAAGEATKVQVQLKPRPPRQTTATRPAPTSRPAVTTRPAGSGTTIVGQLVDAEGNPVPDAEVFVATPSRHVSLVDADGEVTPAARSESSRPMSPGDRTPISPPALVAGG
ncbi:MAG TPA: carboxypeptidase regulatory-like domain-containing protein, partial [Phycisphaerae bacterium]|nr:carboxypeptidase regulatory-like domain-containing protein [Phycisphaerae bacterium]